MKTALIIVAVWLTLAILFAKWFSWAMKKTKEWDADNRRTNEEYRRLNDSLAKTYRERHAEAKSVGQADS